MNKRFTIALWLFLFLIGCAAALGSEPSSTASSVPIYDLRINLLPDLHRLAGAGSVLLPASDKPRDSVVMGLSEQMRDFTVEVLEPKESAGVARLEKKEMRGQTVIWTVTPTRSFPATKPVRFRFSWSGGEKTAFVFHLGTEGSFASGVNTSWYPRFENGYATGTLQISVPPGDTVHASGARRSTTEEMSRGIFRFESSVPTYFAFVSGKYSVVRRDGKIPVSVYLLRPRPNTDQFIDGSLKTFDVLVKEFGHYPYGEFAIVEVPEGSASKAGFTGASVEGFIMAVGSFLDQGFNLAYYGHEISHQWWGNLIKHKGNHGRHLLDEAMAQYGSLRVVETIEGAKAAEQYRRKGYPGYYANQSGFGYLLQAAAGNDYPLSKLPDAGNFRSLTNGKGFFVWDMLARTVGRKQFARILGEFTKQRAFQRITWEEFLSMIQKRTGRDLKWFYAQWFDRPGAPDWRLTWKQKRDTLHGIITQPAPYYRAVIEVQAQGMTQRLTRTVEVDGAQTEFKWHVRFPAEVVVLDPHFLTLRWTPEYRAEVAAQDIKKPITSPSDSQKLTAAEQELVVLERQWMEGVFRGDKTALEHIMADEFTITGLTNWGESESKAEWIITALKIAGRLKQGGFNFDRSRVRIYDNTALVNSSLTLKGLMGDKPIEMKYLILDLWIKREGRWQVAARYQEKVTDNQQ